MPPFILFFQKFWETLELEATNTVAQLGTVGREEGELRITL